MAPSKRPRPAKGPAKGPANVGGLIARWIESLVHYYDTQEQMHGLLPATRFQGPPPSIPIGEYVRRIHKYGDFSPRVPFAAVHYLAKISAENTTSLRLDSRTAHRLVAVAYLTACKFLDDDNQHSNREWSKIAGVPLAELNTLEITFLKHLDFRVSVWAHDLELAEQSLLVFIRTTNEIEELEDEAHEAEDEDAVVDIVSEPVYTVGKKRRRSGELERPLPMEDITNDPPSGERPAPLVVDDDSPTTLRRDNSADKLNVVTPRRRKTVLTPDTLKTIQTRVAQCV